MKINQPEIADYDEFNYDYTQYWNNRDYEHQSEIYALNRLLKDQQGKWFIDLGGSFGRHLPQYHNKYKNSVISDYSINALKQAQKTILKNNIKNIYLVAANIYQLPFKSETFDGGIMIRVLHHLEDQRRALLEIRRSLKSNSTFILEFANKMHIKNRIRFLVKQKNDQIGFGNNTNNLEVKSSETPEGSTKESKGIMFNYHPQYIKQLLEQLQFTIIDQQALSFMRIPLLKKILPKQVINILELSLQAIMRKSQITPSVMLKIKTQKKKQKSDLNTGPKINERLCCPKCKGSLSFTQTQITCSKCNESFQIINGIYDLRYPKPQYES